MPTTKNSVVLVVDCNLSYRALEPMESRDFKTGVRISYIDQVEHAERRQRHLLTNYYFECGCPRCKDASDEERLMFAAHCSACDQDVDLKPSKNDLDEPDLCCPNCGRIKCKLLLCKGLKYSEMRLTDAFKRTIVGSRWKSHN